LSLALHLLADAAKGDSDAWMRRLTWTLSGALNISAALLKEVRSPENLAAYAETASFLAEEFRKSTLSPQVLSKLLEASMVLANEGLRKPGFAAWVADLATPQGRRDFLPWLRSGVPELLLDYSSLLRR
jgi:hypothetical protein